MSSSFTSHDDLCSTRLQSLVCKGHVLIAKVLRASNELPAVFLSGYTIDEFTVITTKEKKNQASSTSNSSSSSSSSYFFGASVLNILGSVIHKSSNLDQQQPKLKKIRSQAPSYKQSCIHDLNSDGNSSRRNDNDNANANANANNMSSNYGKYTSIIVDFSYLSNPDKFDNSQSQTSSSSSSTTTTGNKNTQQHHTGHNDTNQKRKSAAEQEQLEREFAMKYQSTLKKYYNLFEDIYNFYLDVNNFTSDLGRGYFVNYNLRSLLLENNCEGGSSSSSRQLLCEVLYLCGSLLILLDMYIPVSRFFVSLSLFFSFMCIVRIQLNM